LGLDLHPALRVELVEDPGELANRGIVDQAPNLFALEGIGQSLVEASFEIKEAARRIVLAQLGLAFAAPRDIDQLNREPAVAQMKAEIMADADRVDSHKRQAAAELIQKVDHLSAGVGSAPGAHSDDPATVGLAL